ncbi:hypothetical protein LUZ61_014870 [Rhynchospora tenuis]|uniref:Uncharacterized protein n=1 Tax=Rhynchospora tenuis TaxID=198213 RepID=A0AAD5WBI9_9POAL|nr:hypothetical protein LUZ61_014870 [Rhynchospora tenuis]
MGINKVYDRYFIRKEIKQFEEFHVAFIDLFRDFTSLFPGTRYNVPTSEEIEEFYREWKNLEEEEEKKTQFCDFMNKNIVFSDTHHHATLVTGIVAPTAAVIVKNTWKNTPVLNIIPLHHIPTFIFVPSSQSKQEKTPRSPLLFPQLPFPLLHSSLELYGVIIIN